MFKALQKRLKTKSGTSMAEMLITVLLVSLMGLTITAGIGAVQSAYDKVVRKANEQTILSTTLLEMKDWIRYSTDFDEDTKRFHSNNGTWFAFRNANEGEHGIQIEFYAEKLSPEPTTTMPVVPTASGDVSKVYSSFTDISRNNGKIKIEGLGVGREGETPANAMDYTIVPISSKARVAS